jgi:HTH-type transcriptional regulator, cell division transcriptional repressor
MQINSFIKSRRVNIGMTQRELAEKLDVTVTTISKWELGLAVPSNKNLKKVCKVLGMQIKDFTESEDNKC